jgi:GAF domain-containing protein
LRRVATLVARGSAPGAVFAAIVEEVARLLPVEYAGMGRYESDGTMTTVADSGRPIEAFPIVATLVC